MPAIPSISGSGKNTHGFTLIEIIATLVIIGIVSAVAVSIFSSLDKYKLASEVEILKTHLRYAQSRAMSDNVSWGIVCSEIAGSYTLLKNGLTATSNLPNENSPTHNLKVRGVNISNDIVNFDNFGSPGVASIGITVSAGVESKTITVTANTGFIP